MQQSHKTVLWVILSICLVMLWNNWQEQNGQPTLFGQKPAQTQQQQTQAQGQQGSSPAAGADGSIPAAPASGSSDASAAVPGNEASR